MYNPILVFDIETKIDVQVGRLLYDLELNDDDCEQALIKIRRQETGQDFQKLALHEIVCISGLWVKEGDLKLFSWTQAEFSESDIIQKFFRVFQKYQTIMPKLVTWNGSQFDLPLLMIRAMIHGLSSPQFWDNGELFNQKRYQNYTNRYHHQHIDLMDNLSLFHQKHFAKLDDIARILGFAGKEKGFDGLQAVKQQDWESIARYCESDVLNTWLIYLRWIFLKGQINREQHHGLVWQTKHLLETHVNGHDFLQRWQKNAAVNPISQQFFEHLSS